MPLPDEDGCRALWDLWHHPNREGESYVWNGDGFDSRFLGDLYQDLDKDIRKRFALLQTPHFVESYILDHTLTPALAEFDPAKLRAVGQTFRVIDPTCGSGHFLIGAFHRLADYWRDRHGLSEWAACERALESVWGCDINPHAIDIAEFRLLLEVVARTGVKDLERLSWLKLNLRAMDSLIPWERAGKQGEMFPARDRLDAYATPAERRENAEFLARDFHVVVGNPPYIRAKDKRKIEDYRVFWPHSATGRYALSAPFAERFFVIGARGSFIGQITANSFAKRSFGRSLIENVLAHIDLTHIVDAAGAYIPGHGTPTVILFGRHLLPTLPTIQVILGKRGEAKRPPRPELAPVWTDIVRSPNVPDDSSPYISVAHVERAVFASHPWMLGGGLASELKTCLEETASADLSIKRPLIGNTTQLKGDDLYFDSPPAVRRDSTCPTIVLLEGEYVRDWDVMPGRSIPYPYIYGTKQVIDLPTQSTTFQNFWRHRTRLNERPAVGFKTIRARGQKFYEFPFHAPHTVSGLGIAFAFVGTHNQFVLTRGNQLFKQSVYSIKFPPSVTLDEHLDILGLLNSSTIGFWMKQVFHNKGYGASGDGARTTAQDWENFFEYDSTKLRQTPLTERDRPARVELARALDATAQERATAAGGISEGWRLECRFINDR